MSHLRLVFNELDTDLTFFSSAFMF